MSFTGMQDAVGRLRAAVGALLTADLSQLADAALLEAMRELRPVVCQVQAAEARLIHAVHVRGAAGHDGARSTAAWLRNGLRVHDASQRVRASMALDRLPDVAAAFAAGEISEAHVAAIAKVAPDLTDEALAAGAEKLLVDEARKLNTSRFAQAATRIRDESDPEAADRRRRRRLEDRWLQADRTFEGAVAISGILDPDAGELLLTTLSALMPPPCAGDNRSASTRRADALLDLCRLAAEHAPVAGGAKPQIVVTADLETLRSRVGEATGRGATLGSGWSIGPDTARRLACDAGIVPLLIGSNSEPLDIGRLTRSVPPALRRALVYRDGGCRFPLCDRPPEWTDAHHILSWLAGGPTALWNLVLLCRAHHVLVHEQGWHIALDTSTGLVSVGYPDGQPFALTSSPRGPQPVRGTPPGTTQRRGYECA